MVSNITSFFFLDSSGYRTTMENDLKETIKKIKILRERETRIFKKKVLEEEKKRKKRDRGKKGEETSEHNFDVTVECPEYSDFIPS